MEEVNFEHIERHITATGQQMKMVEAMETEHEVQKNNLNYIWTMKSDHCGALR